jgi:predicted Zn-dependent protease
MRLGQYDNAVSEGEAALATSPNNPLPYENLAETYRDVNRIDAAVATIQAARDRHIESSYFHRLLYSIASLRNDAGAMAKEAASGAGRPDECWFLFDQSDRAAEFGHLQTARDISLRARELAVHAGLLETAANRVAADALREASFGNFGLAQKHADAALALRRTPTAVAAAAQILGIAGKTAQADALFAELKTRYPNDTILNAITIPAAQGAIDVSRNHPDQALDALQSALLYDRGAFPVLFFRGQAYLQAHQPAEAAAEFQKIADRRSTSPLSYYYPLALLNRARAEVAAGNSAAARKTYADFLAFWKDADADIPVLREARREAAALK